VFIAEREIGTPEMFSCDQSDLKIQRAYTTMGFFACRKFFNSLYGNESAD